MVLQRLLADFCRKHYFAGHGVPVQIGVYRPSVLSWSCLRKQYNYYALLSGKEAKEIPDDTVLLLAGGVVFHRLVQSLRDNNKPYWDKVEVECSVKVEVAGGEIAIVGHADAIKDGAVYEFKHTRTLPSKPTFPHVLQLNFYLAALRMLRGVLVYTGYDAEGGLSVREFPILYSDWHFEHLISRAQTLHVLLVNKEPPRCSCREKRHELETII